MSETTEGQEPKSFRGDSEYDKLCKMSLKIITENKRLKAVRNSLENEISELKGKLSKLERNKGVEFKCTTCQILRIDNEKLKEEVLKLTQFQKSTLSLNEMLSIQKPSGDKSGLGFYSFEASTSETKETKFVKSQNETSSGGGPPTIEGGTHNAQTAPKVNQGPLVCSSKKEQSPSSQKFILGSRPKHIMVNNVKIHVARDDEVEQFNKPSLKPGVGFSKPNFRTSHKDLFGSSAIWKFGGNLYTLVIVDDYSRTDHGREFDNEVQFGEFCNANGITHNFSAPRTPQSNGVVERKNRTLQEMSRTMLNEQSLPQKFWCNAVDTSTYILNRILIRAILGKTPYELLRGRKPTLDYFRVFGSKCFILNTKDYLTKFDPKSYEGVFLGYSQNSKAYIILNKHTMKIEESLNVTFDETPPPSKTSPLVDDDLDEEEAIKVTEKKNLENDIEDETLKIDEIVKESKNHPLKSVIGNLNQRTLRSQAQNQSDFFCFISAIEPKNVNEALKDESRIIAMPEKLNQFVANDVWELVPHPKSTTIIGTKWVYRNKLDENDVVSCNKGRLVAQVYNQQEGVDYDETYATVARLEYIRILLPYAYTLDFKLFQMDIRSAFLNSFINEEVYVVQPPGFIDFKKPDQVF
ncbi:retrovirus-related pol polyprotein from transposon TNT 1-94 [Tanacetum coccineum]|uniref:Retrovirus-related pol polyprotein from transposon TNT 1-94 n=1 Tax=Tanacetum coccineum TaxID=301880 RepID=A0ABQ5GGK0_9ASTR